MRLRVGIVGLGPQWESRYLPALRLLTDRFEVRGVCEQLSHRAERAAAPTPPNGGRSCGRGASHGAISTPRALQP